jgi:hypothetical protein
MNIKIIKYPLEKPEISIRFFFLEKGSMDYAHLTFTGIQLYLYKQFLQIALVL